MLTTDEARARVAKGAAHLDVVRPGWHDRIDVGTLTMWDSCLCIVGQLCGDYWLADELSIPKAQRYRLGVGIQPGVDFNRSATECKATWGPIQDAWIDAIADRRLSQESATSPACDAVDPAVRQPISVATRA